jgi:hypothetical protein
MADEFVWERPSYGDGFRRGADLTVTEWFAGMALVGMLANKANNGLTEKELTQCAYMMGEKMADFFKKEEPQ